MVHRRLFAAFLRSGGDISDATAVQRFTSYVESSLLLLSPKLRTALEIAWEDAAPGRPMPLADRLSEAEGVQVTAAAARQRLSRGARLLEQLIAERSWERDVAATPTATYHDTAGAI